MLNSYRNVGLEDPPDVLQCGCAGLRASLANNWHLPSLLSRNLSFLGPVPFSLLVYSLLLVGHIFQLLHKKREVADTNFENLHSKKPIFAS